MATETPNAYPSSENSGPLAPNGLSNEAYEILRLLYGAPQSDKIDAPRGTPHGEGVKRHINDMEALNSRNTAMDIDRVNASKNVDAVLDRVAASLGRPLTDVEKGTIQQMAETAKRGMPDAKRIINTLASTLFTDDASGMEVVNQLVTTIDTALTGPAGSARPIVSPLMSIGSPVIGANNTDIATRELLTHVFPPGSNGDITGKMSAEEVLQFIQNEAANGRNYFSFNPGEADNVIKNSIGTTSYIVPEETLGNITEAENYRNKQNYNKATSFKAAIDKAATDKGESYEGRKAAIDYLTANEKKSYLKESLENAGITVPSLNTDADLSSVITQLDTSIETLKVGTPRHAQLQSLKEQVLEQKATREKVSALKITGGVSALEAAAQENYNNQIEKLYGKEVSNKTDLNDIVAIQNKVRVIYEAGFDPEKLVTNTKEIKRLKQSPRISKEVKDSLQYLEDNQEKATKYSTATDKLLKKDQASAKINEYGNLLKTPEDFRSPEEKIRFAELEHDETIVDFKASINIANNTKKLVSDIRDFQVFRKSVRGSSPDLDPDNLKHVSAVLEEITKGTLNTMSDEDRESTVLEISSLMSEQNAGASAALEAAKIGAQTAQALGEDGGAAGVLAAKAGLTAYNTAIKQGKTAVNAKTAMLTAAKQAGEAANSATAHGIGGLQSYLRKNPYKLYGIKDGKEKEILKKILNKQSLSAEESDFIGKTDNLRRLMKTAGASESDIVRMYNSKTEGEDKRYADSVAYQATAKNERGVWAARDTMNVLAQSATVPALKMALTGEGSVETQEKLMNLLFENPEISKVENADKAKELIREKFKGTALENVLTYSGGLEQIQDILRQAKGEYEQQTGRSFEESAQLIKDAQNFTENTEKSYRDSLLEKEAPATFASTMSNVMDVILSNPKASASELFDKINRGGFSITGIEDQNKIARFMTARLLNDDVTTAKSVFRGHLAEDKFAKAQGLVKKLYDAGLYEKYSKYASGNMTEEEDAQFVAEMKDVFGRSYKENDRTKGADADFKELQTVSNQIKDVYLKRFNENTTESEIERPTFTTQIAAETDVATGDAQAETTMVSPGGIEVVPTSSQQQYTVPGDGIGGPPVQGAYIANGGGVMPSFQMPSITDAVKALTSALSESPLAVKVVEIDETEAQKLVRKIDQY